MQDPNLMVQYSAAPLIKASFCISGRDFDPALVTRELGIEATSIWKQSDQQLRARLDLDNIGWYLTIEDKESRSVSVAVEHLLQRVLPVAARLPEVLRQTCARAGVEVTVTITEDRPVYDVSQSAIKDLATLDCSFGLDIFDYSSP